MIDRLGRNITYLRISVTDKCNLRCRYCMPAEGVCKKNHADMLTEDEIIMAVEVAASIPLERIVLETDCPYMAPEPFRGKRNDPGKIYRMAEKLAEIRGLPVEEIHTITTENGKRLYRI